jgi:hypothetical protein
MMRRGTSIVWYVFTRVTVWLNMDVESIVEVSWDPRDDDANSTMAVALTDEHFVWKRDRLSSSSYVELRSPHRFILAAWGIYVYIYGCPTRPRTWARPDVIWSVYDRLHYSKVDFMRTQWRKNMTSCGHVQRLQLISIPTNERSIGNKHKFTCHFIKFYDKRRYPTLFSSPLASHNLMFSILSRTYISMQDVE